MIEQDKREKLIEALECCLSDVCVGCPKMENCDWDESCDGPEGVMRDALALLKAQEPQAVSIRDGDGGTTHWYACGACQSTIQPGDKYCHECGRAVKWE